VPDGEGDKQLNVRVNRLVADWVEFAAAERGVTQAWLVERLLMECSERMRPLAEWRLTYTPEEVAERKLAASYRAGAGVPPVYETFPVTLEEDAAAEAAEYRRLRDEHG
jgi:hypothetical protein